MYFLIRRKFCDVVHVDLSYLYPFLLGGSLLKSALLKRLMNEWLDSTNKNAESTYQYNVAVATLQYSTGF